MVLFFVLAGASLHLDGVAQIGVLGAACIALRTLSRFVGGWLGGWLAGAPDQHRHWMGVALIPQAGVALGMALVASSHLPQFKETILAVTIGTTVVFELVGPALTQLAVRKVGEARK
jgi:Kef-type K+ transport system membrane component KefB